MNSSASYTTRGVFDVLRAAAFGGIATHLALLAGFSWWMLWVVVLLFSHAGYSAVSAYCSLVLGTNPPSAAWYIKGLGYILASLLLSGGALAQEISLAWFLAAVLVFALGLMYLKLGHALGSQNASVGDDVNAQEIPVRTARIVWTVILLSHAIILVVALTGIAEV
ncbi:MAG: hypothetical protein ACREOG_15120, partial [Gemmatimonadaceae bacterium]